MNEIKQKYVSEITECDEDAYSAKERLGELGKDMSDLCVCVH